MLGLKLLFAGTAGLIGSCIYSASMPVINNSLKPISFWEIGENDVFPLFTCRGGGNHYQLGLAFKKEEGATKKKKERLYLRGWDFKNNKELDWNELVGSNNYDKFWQLQVYSTGATKLETLSGAEGHLYSQHDAPCEGNKWRVTKPTYTSGTEWTNSVSKITLEAKDCNDDLTNEGCKITINSDVGLQWNPELEKQLTFSKASGR
ncbi:hypothetical protein WEN_01645 [Mycoplasma wenyonii str. Massachusetts]|uniref:Lipoprotein n=1 Tax=Mycoplasma wenyonii (strain Massachusetts) TaxID=1197325 RepID=I6ZEU4_MYCWM|nr:hypothetical protein [Mycoplasma wenyonii]AFN65122.1 hypothetical protein WEN_01645 [Mycoplasma wenyonii str. Massachusetts]